MRNENDPDTPRPIYLKRTELMTLANFLERLAVERYAVLPTEVGASSFTVVDVTITRETDLCVLSPYPTVLWPGADMVFLNDSDCDFKLTFSPSDRFDPPGVKIAAQSTAVVHVTEGPTKVKAKCRFFKLPEDTELKGTGNGANMEIDNP